MGKRGRRLTSAEASASTVAGRSFERTVAVRVLLVLAAAFAVYGWRHNHHLGLTVGTLIAARAVALGRPFTIGRFVASIFLLFLGFAAAKYGHQTLTAGAEIAAGAVVGLPRRAPEPATESERLRVRALVDSTSGDTLAPFALRTDKSFVFTEDRSAAVAYKVRFGTAVASGDPVGNPESFEAAIDAFLAMAERNGWRPTVLGAGEQMREAWRRRGMRGVCIGRDVVLDVASFSMTGRHNRNLRQAVARATNAGITTTIVSEHGLDLVTRAALMDVARGAHKGGGTERGFSMILDHLLDGTHTNTMVAYARDASGRVVAFQRYALADGGRELSLDVPYRLPDAPNGVDERLIADVISWARERSARRVSLAFAAFPELFAATKRSVGQKAVFRAVHQLDRWIRLESLYRFLKKFNAFGPGRYVMLRPAQVLFVLVSALTLEFSTTAPGAPVALQLEEAAEPDATPHEAR